MNAQEIINILRNNGFGFVTIQHMYILNLNWKYNKTGLKCYCVSQGTIKHLACMYDGNQALRYMENEINEYLAIKGINEKFKFIMPSSTHKKEYNVCQEFTTYQTDLKT